MIDPIRTINKQVLIPEVEMVEPIRICSNDKTIDIYQEGLQLPCHGNITAQGQSHTQQKIEINNDMASTISNKSCELPLINPPISDCVFSPFRQKHDSHLTHNSQPIDNNAILNGTQELYYKSNIIGSERSFGAVGFNIPGLPLNVLGMKDPFSFRENEDNLLKEGKQPRIDCYTIIKLLFARDTYLVSGNLRIYDIRCGAFKEMTVHDMKVKIYDTIPEHVRRYATFSDVENIFKLMSLTSSIQVDPNLLPTNERYINCLDGILDLDQMQVLEHSPHFYFMNYVNAQLFPSETGGEVFKGFIKTVTGGDLELERLLKQWTGYTISNFNNSKKACLCIGDTDCGKSVFLSLLAHLCGEDNTSDIELQKLSKKEYVASLYGKLLNVCNELPDEKICDTGTFKSLVSCTDKISARPLYSNPFSFRNKAKLVFATNNLPQIKMKPNFNYTAYFNRWIMIPFMTRIPEHQQDKNLLEKLKQETGYILRWAIEGLKEYIANGYTFSKCSISESISSQYRSQIDPLRLFIEECCNIEKDNDDLYVHKCVVENAYKKFCDNKNFPVPTSKDINELQQVFEDAYRLEYKKINRNGQNKYGFKGLSLK